MKKFLALTLAMLMVLSLAACGAKDVQPSDAVDTDAPEESAAPADSDLLYAVEGGSAGEAAANERGWRTVVVEAQSNALMEVAAGTSDAAIIDLLMAGAMIGEGTSYPNLTYTDKLTTEEYGIGCRKDSNLTDYINEVLAETYADGSMKAIATTYGVQEALLDQAAPSGAYPEGGDVAYIQDKGTLIVGITDFAPMDYTDADGSWIGFDADMAKLVAEKLGVEAQFVEIEWGNKIMELDAKSIDVVWNGMTLTDEVTNAMNCTVPYCNNAQVVVVPSK